MESYLTQISKGTFDRPARTFRNWVTSSANYILSKSTQPHEFKAEPNRYHLYVSLACPWAHRTLIVRKLKGLEDVISVNVVDWYLEKSVGWSFDTKNPATTGDTVNGAKTLREIYQKADPNYSNSVTVPVLWDKKTQTIVNNESSEIIRMLNSEFNEYATNKELDLYPSNLRTNIDEVNSWIYEGINNGVYRAGFAQKQESYEQAYTKLFESLDKVEKILAKNRYLCGDQITEADVRLATTLFRFDVVYYTHFKCNKKRIVDYSNLWNFTKELYQMEQIKSTVNFQHIKQHYFGSHKNINPFGIVPLGPDVNFDESWKRPNTSM